MVLYFHRACFSPVVSTLKKAIDAGYFNTWSGLASALVRKHLLKSIATAKGHIRQDHQNVRSAKPLPTSATVPPPHVMTTSSIPTNANVRTHSVFTKTMSVSGRVFSNQTGRFSHTSSRGTKYVMIFYDYYLNPILTEPIKSCSELNLTRSFANLKFQPNYSLLLSSKIFIIADLNF